MQINSLLNSKLISKNNEVKFDYEKYWNAVNAICDDIKKKYDLKNEKIGLIGMARGALPLLTSISHELGIREISIIQFQMSNSDNMHDYGNVRLINEMISDNYDCFILLEDIIYKGKTTDAAITHLKSKNKKVIGVYSLIVDEGFKDVTIKNDNVEINYAYDLNKDDWVYFNWECDINKLPEKKDCESLLIEVNQKCNLNCSYCFYNDYGREKAELKKDDISKILSNYGKIENIYLTGGECTIACDFIDILEECNKKAPVSIFTNGVTLSNINFFNKIDSYIKNYIVTMDDYKLDYPCRKRIDDTIKCIKNIVSNSPDKLIVKVCINKYNINYLENIFEYLKELGVKKISVNFVHNIITSENQFELNEEELENAFDVLDKNKSIRYINYYDEIKQLYLNKKDLLTDKCKAGKSFFFYDCKGVKHDCPANCNKLKTCLSKECTSLYEMF